MDIISIITTLILIALCGFLVYLIVTYVPMPEPFKQTIIVAVVILLILWLIYMVAGQVPAGIRR